MFYELFLKHNYKILIKCTCNAFTISSFYQAGMEARRGGNMAEEMAKAQAEREAVKKKREEKK